MIKQLHAEIKDRAEVNKNTDKALKNITQKKHKGRLKN